MYSIRYKSVGDTIVQLRGQVSSGLILPREVAELIEQAAKAK
jgi:hypothetical protein